jgi:hypothetical protein
VKQGDTAIILRSALGNAGKRCKLIDALEGAKRYWWVVVYGGTVAEGLIAEADLAPEPGRVACAG